MTIYIYTRVPFLAISNVCPRNYVILIIYLLLFQFHVRINGYFHGKIKVGKTVHSVNSYSITTVNSDNLFNHVNNSSYTRAFTLIFRKNSMIFFPGEPLWKNFKSVFFWLEALSSICKSNFFSIKCPSSPCCRSPSTSQRPNKLHASFQIAPSVAALCSDKASCNKFNKYTPVTTRAINWNKMLRLPPKKETYCLAVLTWTPRVRLSHL